MLALNIAEAVSQGLGLERDHIEKAFGQGWQIMAANFYPPCPQPNLTLGLSPHWDNGALTLLVQNVVDGLQVKHKGRWVAARPTPGMFTVILGNYMEVSLTERKWILHSFFQFYCDSIAKLNGTFFKFKPMPLPPHQQKYTNGPF